MKLRDLNFHGYWKESLINIISLDKDGNDILGHKYMIDLSSLKMMEVDNNIPS